MKIGDGVQWTNNGVEQFVEPRKIDWISDCGQWATVEGSNCGVPVKELTLHENWRRSLLGKQRRKPPVKD